MRPRCSAYRCRLPRLLASSVPIFCRAPSAGVTESLPMPGYQVKHQQVAVAGAADLEIRSLLDRDQFADPLGEAAAAGISPATWPLFGQVWPSAQKLADLMQTWEIAGKRVLEIGCGLALASLVIQRRQGDVTASDCHPLAETFLAANASLNGLPSVKYGTGNWGRDNPQLLTYDLIIGSDVLYERSHPQQLCGFIAMHAAPRCEVLIIDPNRSNRNAFHRAMAVLGFSLQESMIEAPLHDGSAYRGRLLRYCRAPLGGGEGSQPASPSQRAA